MSAVFPLGSGSARRNPPIAFTEAGPGFAAPCRSPPALAGQATLPLRPSSRGSACRLLGARRDRGEVPNSSAAR